jgi:hypothetical protein
LLDVLIIDVELAFQVVQLGIIEDRPPVPANFGVGRLSHCPISVVLRPIPLSLRLAETGAGLAGGASLKAGGG